MKISDKGIDLIKQSEGCRLISYKDSRDVWTIGYGWTNPVDGKSFGADMTITEEKADSLLRSGLSQYEKGVESLVKVTINQSQFDALVDFAYNLGVAALADSTLLKKLNAGDYAGAADEFLKWNKAGGQVLQGLTRRREAERSLFLS